MRCGEGRARLASVSAARLPHEPPRYLVVIRPAESEVAMLHAGAGKGLVAESPAMQGIVRLIEQLGRSTANLLITGESGVGKEAVARAFHENSPRRGGPFVAINCAAIPDTLLESEFFGHRHGAFTGAIEDRVGRFEAAADGTLFLDEIGDLPHHLQAKLLRVLQERTFSRLGENRQRRLDARIIAATNADLQQAVAEGSFREDLYYRLSVVPIRIPPLRERPEDIEPLTRHLLLRISGREGRALLLSPDTLRLLQRYPWPGNVRQLQNVIEFAVAMCRGQTLRPDHLPQEVRDAAWLAGPADDPAQTHPPAWASGQGGGHPPPATEADRILRALEANHWRRQATARALGMSRSTLWRKMREYGIQG
jgi:DNA-binding NtrC family response regulator